MDITYLPMARGFVYLAAVLDWATRRILAWRLSNTLTADFCVEALDEATGSVALLADTIHNVGDAANAIPLRIA